LGMIMTIRNGQDGNRAEPSPVTIRSLREHFRTTYNFNEEQIDLMVVSSARSIQAAFLAVDEIVGKEDGFGKIAVIAHGLKGLLLNMGQNDWAEYVKDIENAAKAGRHHEYTDMVQRLRLGLQEVGTIATSFIRKDGSQ
jgi:hypothetical protein